MTGYDTLCKCLAPVSRSPDLETVFAIMQETLYAGANCVKVRFNACNTSAGSYSDKRNIKLQQILYYWSQQLTAYNTDGNYKRTATPCY